MIKDVINKLKNDVPIIIQSDTIYGISMRVSDENLKKINLIKGSVENKKLIILVSTFEMARKFALLNESDKMYFIKANPTTVICKSKTNDETVAIRLIRSQILKDIIAGVGPIFSTSANSSKQTYIEKRSIFDELVGHENVYYWGKLNNKPSNIYDLGNKKYIRKT